MAQAGQPPRDNCPNCGVAVEPGARFCSNCGRPLVVSPTQLVAQPERSLVPDPERRVAPPQPRAPQNGAPHDPATIEHEIPARYYQPPSQHHYHMPPNVPVQQVVTVQGQRGTGCFGRMFQVVDFVVVAIVVLLILILVF